jgi:hypothetical protein
MELSEATRVRSREAGWSEELVERFAQSALKDNQVLNLLALDMGEERTDRFLKLVEDNPDAPYSKLSLRWARPTTEMGIKAVPGEHGLGMEQINIKTYGDVPDVWPYENDTPLGSRPTPGSYMPGSYSVYRKSEVWSNGVDKLYDEAIRKRWAASTDIDWAGLEEQPEAIERAICQICTTLGQHGLAEQKVISKWEERIAYGFHDVKIFLATHVYESGRKFEVLRKRAYANGGGLMQQGFGTLYRAWFGALKSTEFIVAMDVVYKTYEVVMLEALVELAPLATDRQIFGKILEDSKRHLEYGLGHLHYYMQHHPDAAEFVNFYLARAEAALSDELHHSRAEWEALAVLFAGGLEKPEAGLERLRSLREDQLRKYLLTLDDLAIDRVSKVNPGLFDLARNANAAVEAGNRIPS